MGSIGSSTASPAATAQNMNEQELRAYIRDNNLTQDYNIMLNNRRNASYQTQLNTMRDLVADNMAVKRSTADERNARELARVNREARLNPGVQDRQSLKKGESYTMDWTKNETRTGVYIGSRMVNGFVVSEFRQANGKIIQVEDEDFRRLKIRRS